MGGVNRGVPLLFGRCDPPIAVARKRTRRYVISEARPYIELHSERRTYADLDEAEKAVIRLALPKETVTREEVLEELSGNFTKKSLKDAFSQLCDERRLFRVGNKSDHILIERDLFS